MNGPRPALAARLAVCAALLGGGAGALHASPAAAQTGDTEPASATDARCLVLGPLVMSAYLDVLTQVAAGEAEGAAARAGNTADLMALYDRLGCPMSPLRQAVECVSAALIAGPIDQPVAALAETCMAEAGLPTR